MASLATIFLVALASACAFSANSFANAAIVEHTFEVGFLPVSRLCKETNILAVNGQYPGPTIDITEGDTLVVHVINNSTREVTIHWHGVLQRFTNWADGPNMITQCPIQPGNNYTYRFTVDGQVGTLWWHAHIGMLRVTLHGAIIIRPKNGLEGYPFDPKPDGDAVIFVGEWWDGAPWTIEYEYHNDVFDGHLPTANAINGKFGDSYPCSDGPDGSYTLQVEAGKAYMLRLINSAIVGEIFYKIANHTFTVVAIDACYIDPFQTDVIVIGPGQTFDVILVADAPDAARYYMVISNHATFPDPHGYNASTALGRAPGRAILEYAGALPDAEPSLPDMPDILADDLVNDFYATIAGPLWRESTAPSEVDVSMYMIMGLAYSCLRGMEYCEDEDKLLLGHMNNVSMLLPKNKSMLEAHYSGASEGVYTTDFPDEPELYYNFTQFNLRGRGFIYGHYINRTGTGTKVKQVKYGSVVEVVLQSLAVTIPNRHNMHMHGYNFYLMALGHGTYNAKKALPTYNYVNPPLMSTVSVPRNGYAVIRFVADNPGVWPFHCHMDMHFVTGMGMAFVVEDGPTKETSLPPPPADYPKCISSDDTSSSDIEDLPSKGKTNNAYKSGE